MIFESPKTYTEAKIFGSDHKVWLTEEEIETVNAFRNRRRSDGFLINNGPEIIDPLYQEDLESGKQIHLKEIHSLVGPDAMYNLKQVLGDKFESLLSAGAITNPRWI